MMNSQFDSMSRISSNTAGIDYPTVMTAMDEGVSFQRTISAAIVSKDRDMLEEFKYKQWQDVSPDALTGFQYIEESHSRKFVKINVYKLFDFGTAAQSEMQTLKRSFAQVVFA